MYTCAAARLGSLSLLSSLAALREPRSKKEGGALPRLGGWGWEDAYKSLVSPIRARFGLRKGIRGAVAPIGGAD